MSSSSNQHDGNAMANRAVTALEWFDFTLYGAVAATILPKLFFPALEPTSSLAGIPGHV